MPQVWNGSKALRTLLHPLKNFTLDPRNARRHSERNIEAIRVSLRRFGQTKPIVLRDGVVFAGEGTLRAADLEGWTHLAAAPADHLSEDEARAYALADNKTGELADWDYDVMAELFKALPPELHDFTGFTDLEREPILAGLLEPTPASPQDPVPTQPAVQLLFEDDAALHEFTSLVEQRAAQYQTDSATTTILAALRREP